MPTPDQQQSVTLHLYDTSGPRWMFYASKSSRGFWFVLGALFLLQGIYFNKSTIGIIDIGIGIVWILYAVLLPIVDAPREVTFNDAGITGHLGPFRNISVAWSEVRRIDAALYSLTLDLRSGKGVVIKLDNVSYKDHTEAKPGLLSLARGKGVEVYQAMP